MADDPNHGFNLGDLVQLKSGGPVMTVERLVYDQVLTVWFAYGSHRSRLFEPQALKAADEVEA